VDDADLHGPLATSYRHLTIDVAAVVDGFKVSGVRCQVSGVSVAAGQKNARSNPQKETLFILQPRVGHRADPADNGTGTVARPTFLKYAISLEAHSFRQLGHFILTPET